jgi:D-glycero-alpha-D-manno-heptose 1-phosphate guanylyltransferase
MKVTEAVVLAGGMGTRLRTIVADRPKPMAEIRGRPFLEYLLDYLAEIHIRKVILSVGYMHEFIIAHFGQRYRNLELDYAIETIPLGTGGGLRQALLKTRSEVLFVFNGDTYFQVEPDRMISMMEDQQADVVLALRSVADGWRYGNIVTGANGRIVGFSEKGEQHGPAMINGGIYLLKSRTIDDAELPEAFPLETGFFEKKVSELRFFGIPFTGKFIDIGIPETYTAAGEILSK